MRLGVFGGTFDPPHIGHLVLAEEAQAQLALDCVLWVVTCVPPHKLGQSLTPLAIRLEMVEAAIVSNPAFVLSRVDIDRPPPHYAVDTVHLLKKENPNALLVYLMGGDSLRNLPSWHQPLEFVRGCHALGVMRRPGESVNLSRLEELIPGITAKVRFVDAPLIDVAASQIRQRVREGRPFRYLVPSPVYQIIQERNLYRG